MLIETAAASAITAAIRKGRLKYLKRIRIHGWSFLLIAGLLHFFVSVSLIPGKYRYMTILFIYIMIFFCLLMNYKRKSMLIIFAGTFLNFAVIALNNGYMPVSSEGLKFAGYDVDSIRSNILDPFHSIITGSTHIPVLGDIIPIPEPYPFPQMLSIGDCLIMAGVFMFFQNILVRRSESKY